MTSICSAMPIAVTIEIDREHHVDDDDLRDDGGELAIKARAWSSWPCLRRPDGSRASPCTSRNRPPARQDQVAPGKARPKIAKTGCGEADQPGQDHQQRDAEQQRQRRGRSGGRAWPAPPAARLTSTEMNTMLSMPSTISIAVSVNRLAQALASNSGIKIHRVQPRSRFQPIAGRNPRAGRSIPYSIRQPGTRRLQHGADDAQIDGRHGEAGQHDRARREARRQRQDRERRSEARSPRASAAASAAPGQVHELDRREGQDGA